MYSIKKTIAKGGKYPLGYVLVKIAVKFLEKNLQVEIDDQLVEGAFIALMGIYDAIKNYIKNKKK